MTRWSTTIRGDQCASRRSFPTTLGERTPRRSGIGGIWSCRGHVPNPDSRSHTAVCYPPDEGGGKPMATSSERRRAHVVMSVELVREIDALGRSARPESLSRRPRQSGCISSRRVAAFERALATPTEAHQSGRESRRRNGSARGRVEERLKRLHHRGPPETSDALPPRYDGAEKHRGTESRRYPGCMRRCGHR